MAQGRPSKWASVKVKQAIWLDKTGMKIVVWDKYGRKRRGTLFVSIGGLSWYPNKKRNPSFSKGWESL